MSRMATLKETGIELSEEEWRRFEAGVAAELAHRAPPPRSGDSRTPVWFRFVHAPHRTPARTLAAGAAVSPDGQAS